MTARQGESRAAGPRDSAPVAPPAVWDMHCHLDFSPDPCALAREGAALGASFFSCTVSPEGYERAQRLLGREPNVRVGAGLHPWWLADGRCGERDVDALEGLVARARLVGEVGLDFSPRCLGERDPDGVRALQLGAFERVCLAAARAGARVISIHAVRATTEVLDVLERTGAADACACVLHWFSGTSDELTRARRLGCRFSVNLRMLASKRGRAYVRAMDAGQVLLETDLPEGPGELCGAAEMAGALRATMAQLECLRGEELAERVARTSAELLGLGGL